MIDPVEMIEQRMDLVRTQYRESPNMLFFCRTILGMLAEVAVAISEIPEEFHIIDATGEQLTWIGKRMGWPRCHCVCALQPVFGFDCEGYESSQPVAGFCDDGVTWADCGVEGIGELCIADDELYRKFLLVRRYQMLGLFDRASLQASIIHFWGASATILETGNNRVVLAPGRVLTDAETALLQLYPRVLPVTVGLDVRFHFGDPYVFGFGDGWGGFCEEAFPEGTVLVTETGAVITTGDGTPIGLGTLFQGATWMCETDPKPYSC